MNFKTIQWTGDGVRILDQRRLPLEVRYIDCKDGRAVAEAIRRMAIRGAPAIGVAAAMGIALAAKKAKSRQFWAFRKGIERICSQMAETRPTAVNLFWAIHRMEKLLAHSSTIGEMKERLEEEAIRIYEEDREVSRKIGQYGAGLIGEGDGVLTHCNAGRLATAGSGTALAVIYAAWAEGKRFHVFVGETRPLLQGARLTAWELVQEKIPVTLITDGMAGALMGRGKINVILVGADRIARNGDTANKVGTYGMAVLAKRHRIPFYVAAPASTVDLELGSGLDIPIEERAEEEVTHFNGKRITPKGVRAFNPAFDITPHSLIQGIITEGGILRRPFERGLRRIKTAV